MDVCVADAFVEQLPHGPLESWADLLRLVGYVQIRHSQLRAEQDTRYSLLLRVVLSLCQHHFR